MYGGQTAENNVVLKAGLCELGRLMRGKPVANQNSGFVIRSSSSPRLKYVPDPIQADILIHIALAGRGEMPARASDEWCKYCDGSWRAKQPVGPGTDL